jgi:uncharacterized membrane protein YhhN
MTIAAILSGLCAAFVAALVVAEHRGSRRARMLAKPAASAAFLGVAGTLAFGAGAAGYAAWIAVGLALGAAGDVALMMPSKRAFLAGLSLFLLGHAAYVAACASLVPPSEWIAPAAIAPAAAALIALSYLAPHLGDMRVPVLLYITTITAMVIGALAVVASARVVALSPPGGALLAAGASLFFVSDLAVARDRFVAPRFVNKAWGLPAYYAGQLLIAWTLAFR